MKGFWRFIGSAAVALALIGLWQLGADAGLISPVFFPGPDRSFGTLWEQLHEPEFWHAFGETLRRMALGFVSAALIGIAAGALIGLSRNLRDYVEPTLELIRPLPASAVIPVFVLLIGLNERMIIAVIAFASLWPVLLGTVHGFKTIEPRLIEVSRLLHLSPLALVFKIALPNAMPDIFAGLRLALDGLTHSGRRDRDAFRHARPRPQHHHGGALVPQRRPLCRHHRARHDRLPDQHRARAAGAPYAALARHRGAVGVIGDHA